MTEYSQWTFCWTHVAGISEIFSILFKKYIRYIYIYQPLQNWKIMSLSNRTMIATKIIIFGEVSLNVNCGPPCAWKPRGFEQSICCRGTSRLPALFKEHVTQALRVFDIDTRWKTRRRWIRKVHVHTYIYIIIVLEDSSLISLLFHISHKAYVFKMRLNQWVMEAAPRVSGKISVLNGAVCSSPTISYNQLYAGFLVCSFSFSIGKHCQLDFFLGGGARCLIHGAHPHLRITKAASGGRLSSISADLVGGDGRMLCSCSVLSPRKGKAMMVSHCFFLWFHVCTYTPFAARCAKPKLFCGLMRSASSCHEKNHEPSMNFLAHHKLQLHQHYNLNNRKHMMKPVKWDTPTWYSG